MKTLKTLFGATIIVIFLLANTLTASANLSGIKKIIVKGNAIVFLVQQGKESIKVYDTYNPEKTSIKTKGNQLIINSFEDKPVTIYVHVKDIHRIEASNTSNIKIKGQIKVPYLQIILHDQVKAAINLNTKGLYTVVESQVKLKLTGISDDHILVRSKSSTLKMDKFAALKTRMSNAENLPAKEDIKAMGTNTLTITGR